MLFTLQSAIQVKRSAILFSNDRDVIPPSDIYPDSTRKRKLGRGLTSARQGNVIIIPFEEPKIPCLICCLALKNGRFRQWLITVRVRLV
jgi:hypothetical protein